jgi:ABC-type uncharacterized transport system permease subunit
MSTALVEAPAAPPSPTTARRSSLGMWLLAIAGVLALLSFVRIVTGAEDLTSTGTTGAALRLAIPIAMAGLGGLWSERAGVVNIGLEGMMILGTWFGAWAAFNFHNPWVGVIAGILGGMIGGLLHAVATVTFGVDHIVSGVAINILGAGIARFLSALAYQGRPDAGVTQSPQVKQAGTWTLPGATALGDLAKKGWFFISDLAGVIGGLITNISPVTILAVLLLPASYVVLWRTAFGLRLRSCGESPVAAESLGVNVYKYKYIGVIASGGFAGLGGAFLSLVASNFYRENQTGGRGFIGLAAMIFGNWRPGGLAAGAGLFGYTDALQLRQGGTSVHALLLALAIALILFAVWLTTRARLGSGAVSLVIGLAVLLVFLTTNTVPEQLTQITPYVTTLLVLSLASQRLRPPAADGQPYRRGQAK